MAHLQELRLRGFQGELQEDVKLASYVYYHIGGRAQFFVRPESENDILIALKYFSEKKIPLQIIGGGTNLLVRDGGIDGAVLYLGAGLKGDLAILNETSSDIEIRIPSHWPKSQLLSQALHKAWGGLEFSAGIPGTLGGAVWMNAGTKWGNYADVIERVRFCHPDLGFYTKEKHEMGFRYRGVGEGLLDSQTAIVSVDFKLRRDNTHSTSRKLVDEILSYRGQRQPLEFFNCGSVFKNPANSERGAGRLIEAAGLKGTRVGCAMISQKHANFISNLGGATSNDVEALIKLCQNEVEAKFKIKLEPEVIILGKS